MMYRMVFEIQKFLYAQPDAKVANGIFWANRWLGVATTLLGIIVN